MGRINIFSSWSSVTQYFKNEGVQLGTNLLIGFLLMILGVFSSVVIPPISAFMMGKTEYGYFALFQGIFLFISIVSMLGLDGFIVRIIPQLQANYNPDTVYNTLYKGYSMIILVSMIMSLLIWVLSFNLKNSLSLPSVIIFSVLYSSVYYISFIMQAFKYRIMGGFLRNPLMISVILIFGLIILNYYDLLNAQSLTNYLILMYVFVFIISLYYTNKIISINVVNRKSIINQNGCLSYLKILRQSFPMLAFSASFYLMAQTDILLLGIYSTPSEISDYTIASRLALFSSLGLLTVNLFIPQLVSSLSTSNNEKLIQQIFDLSTLFSIVVFFTLSIFVFFISETIMSIAEITSNTWIYVLFILQIGQLVNVLTGSCGYLLTMSGHQNEAAFATMSAASLNIILAISLIPSLGALGAAISTAVAISLSNIYMAIRGVQIIGIKPYFNYKIFHRE